MGKTILNSVFLFFSNYIHENMNLHKYPRFIGEYRNEITRLKMSENRSISFLIIFNFLNIKNLEEIVMRQYIDSYLCNL